MDEEELRAHIVRRLSQGVSENDVILEVCRQSGLTWSEAQALVSDTAAYDQPAIAKRQLPLLALLAAASVAGGIWLAAWSTLALLNPLLAAGSSRGASEVFDAATILLWIGTHFDFIGGIILGAAMIAGGLYGLGRAGIHLFAR